MHGLIHLIDKHIQTILEDERLSSAYSYDRGHCTPLAHFINMGVGGGACDRDWLMSDGQLILHTWLFNPLLSEALSGGG